MVSNIKDDLDELIILSNVKVLITEWIPFGTNHIASMSLKLGASERIKNAMFTQVIDHDPGGTELTVSPGLTEVYVKSEVFGETINFDASIYYPEDPGIIQVEEFGVNVSSMGRILLGLNVDKIASHSRDRVSLDHLSRLMSDIVLDSSKMLETLLTSYQKNLLSLVFMSRHLNRDKYALVICENIMPLKNVEDYLDAEGYECELKQIIEEVIDTVQLKDGFIIIGSHGTLLCSKEFKKYEPVLIDFIGVKALEIFMQNFFTSQFVLNDIIRDIKELIAKSETDPRAVENVQALLSKASGDSTLMKEIQGYLTESVQSFEKNLEKNYLSYDSKLKEISDYLKIKKSLNLLSDRIFDMEKIINGTLKSLEGLAAVTEVISERQMNRVQEALQNNTRNLEDVTRSSERTGVTMEIMEVILAGSLAFDIMDRITGEWSVMSTPDAGTWGAEYLGPLINIPGVWFLISMSLWAVIAFGLYRFMNWMQERSEPVLIARVKVNRPCSIQALNDYLYNKPVTIRDVDDYTDTLRKKVTWIENDLKKWSAREIKIELFFDEKNGFILSYLLEVPRPSGISTEIISEIFESDLIKNKVLT
jgi:WD repeat-containing protein 35